MKIEQIAPVGHFENGTFYFPIRIYYEDTDAGGIVYYANYLKFAERARTEFLRHLGVGSQQESLESERCGFIVRRVEADYLSPAKLDDLLTVTCTVAEEGGASLLLYQEICRQDDVLVKLKVKVAYFNMAQKRPVRIPENIKKALGKNL